jgi:hypothetical protein
MPARPLALIAVGLLTVAAFPRPSLALLRDGLHGKWTATVTADDGGKDHADTFTFTNGDLFTSEQMEKDGFEPASYAGRGTVIGVAEQFDTTLKNKAGDSAHWQGENVGGQLTGTLTITRKNGDVTTFTFKATRQQK